jgi:RNA polymerase sigma-70 factor (ECF subfamily)
LSTQARLGGQWCHVPEDLQAPPDPLRRRNASLPTVVARPPGVSPLTFDDVYDAHIHQVWRGARRLGVPEASLEDVAQDAFVVVHRRLADYDGRAPLASWIYGIVVRVARDHRRRFVRKAAPCTPFDEANPSSTSAGETGAPHRAAERSESVRLLYALLDELDQEKREVLVLAQLEEMTLSEISEVLALNVNTVGARLRAARRAFEEAHARHRARSETDRALRERFASRRGKSP